MRSRLRVVAVVVTIAGAFASVAGADPSNAPTSSILSVVCGAEATSIVMNGNGIFAPAEDARSTAVLIPTALNVTLTFTFAAGGPPAVDHAIVSKQAPIQDTVSCTIPLQPLFTSPDVSATIEGTIVGFWTPRSADSP